MTAQVDNNQYSLSFATRGEAGTLTHAGGTVQPSSVALGVNSEHLQFNLKELIVWSGSQAFSSHACR